MTDEELRLTDRYKVELENAIYFYRPKNDRETELIELLILEKIRVIEELKQENKVERENEELKESIKNYVEGYEHLISTYKKQIEKMKCCYNCKYGRIYFVKEIIVDCLANKVNPNNKYENCDKWECK